MAVNKYLLVSLPLLQGSASQTWESLQSDVSRAAFDTPTYKVERRGGEFDGSGGFGSGGLVIASGAGVRGFEQGVH
jgi:hypothetical protein